MNVHESRGNRYRVWNPLSLIGNLSYRRNLRADGAACANFRRPPYGSLRARPRAAATLA